MATIKQRIAQLTGAGSVATQYKKSARTSATTFVNALRKGNSNARKALGLRSATKGRTTRNLVRRKSTGGMGG